MLGRSRGLCSSPIGVIGVVPSPHVVFQYLRLLHIHHIEPYNSARGKGTPGPAVAIVINEHRDTVRPWSAAVVSQRALIAQSIDPVVEVPQAPMHLGACATWVNFERSLVLLALSKYQTCKMSNSLVQEEWGKYTNEDVGATAA